jgi:hypothetical protein
MRRHAPAFVQTALALALGLLLAAPLAAQPFSTLEERMSAADFKRAGLDKLSEEELAQLNAWLQRDGAVGGNPPGASVPQGDRRGFRTTASAASRDPVSSRLIGESTGWTYGTVFRLENGQVWRSTDRHSRLVGIRLTNPQVEIRQGLMGNWRLKFADYNSSTQVERLE